MPTRRSSSSTPRRRWDDESRLPPWVIQTFGAVLVAAVFVFYFFTREVSPLLLSAAIGLVSAGSVRAVAENAVKRRTAERAVSHGRRRTDQKVAGGDE